MCWPLNSPKIQHGERKSIGALSFAQNLFNFHFRATAVSHDGKYVFIFIDEKGDDNLVYYVDLEKNGEITGKLSLKPIITEFNNTYSVRSTEPLQ